MATTHPVLTRPDRCMYLYRITIVQEYLHTMQYTATIYTAHSIPVCYHCIITITRYMDVTNYRIYTSTWNYLSSLAMNSSQYTFSSLLSHQPRPAWVSAKRACRAPRPPLGSAGTSTPRVMSPPQRYRRCCPPLRRYFNGGREGGTATTSRHCTQGRTEQDGGMEKEA